MPVDIKEFDDPEWAKELLTEETAAEEDAAQEPVKAAASRKKITETPEVEEEVAAAAAEPEAPAEVLPVEEVTVVEVAQEVIVPTIAVNRDSGFTIHLA